MALSKTVKSVFASVTVKHSALSNIRDFQHEGTLLYTISASSARRVKSNKLSNVWLTLWCYSACVLQVSPPPNILEEEYQPAQMVKGGCRAGQPASQLPMVLFRFHGNPKIANSWFAPLRGRLVEVETVMVYNANL